MISSSRKGRFSTISVGRSGWPSIFLSVLLGSNVNCIIGRILFRHSRNVSNRLMSLKQKNMSSINRNHSDGLIWTGIMSSMSLFWISYMYIYIYLKLYKGNFHHLTYDAAEISLPLHRERLCPIYTNNTIIITALYIVYGDHSHNSENI